MPDCVAWSVQEKNRCQSLVLGKRTELLAHLQLSHASPVLPGSAALCYCPRLPFPAVYRAEKPERFCPGVIL